MKSKILNELFDSTNFAPRRGQGLQDFASELILKVQALSDADWDKLSEDAQTYFNTIATVHNDRVKNGSNDKFPEPSDAEHEDETPPARTGCTRVQSGDGETAQKPAAREEYKPRVKDVVTIVTKRDKVVTGKIVEMDKDEIVLAVDGSDEDQVFERDRIKSIDLAEAPGKSAKDDDGFDPNGDPEVGDTVQVVTARDKTVMGIVKEITADDIVLTLTDGDEQDYALDRLKSITIKVKGKKAGAGKSAKDDDGEKSTGRRDSKKSEDESPDAGEKKRTRSTNDKGVSVGRRIRELIAENLDITEEQVTKTLQKEEIPARDSTVTMIYKDTMTVIELLKKAKRLK